MITTTRIKVERNVQTGISATNTPTLSLVTVFNGFPANIQPNTSQIVYVEAGQTVIADKVLFVQGAVIVEKDIITDLKTGEKFRAMNVNPWPRGQYEIALKGGVV
jgi:hypothetical protein